MINRLLSLLLFVLLTTTVEAQSVFWRDISVAPEIGRSLNETAEISDYRAIAVDMKAFKTLLESAPKEGESNSRSNPLKISFPLPNGGVEHFLVYRSSVMMPRLAVKYPNIQSFRLVGMERANSYGRLTYGTNGLSAVLHTRSGELFIDALSEDSDDLYRVYRVSDIKMEETASAALSCGFKPGMVEPELDLDEWEAERPVYKGRSGSAAIDISVYTLALACTGEYAEAHGGTIESVLSSYNEALSLLNDIYENELAIRFVLSEHTEKLIWLDPQFDPFSNPTSGTTLLDQVTKAFTDDAKITLSSFDVGHIFTGNCEDVGGVAIRSSACNFNREKGVTCHSSTNVKLMVRRVMSHEVGHQFSATHTFTNCPGAGAGQTISETAVEPGSGSTIMSYAGICGSQNVIGDNDAYFHALSLDQITKYTRVGTGRTCATKVTIDNTDPIVNMPYPNGMYIPVSTPFQLNGSATDNEEDPLTYCWEQFDTGPASPLGNPEGNTPLFRSFPPTPDSKRIFPQIENIVINTPDRTEVLPDYERDLTFRLTARDNHPGGGGVSWKEVAFRTTESAGPFVVLSPDTDRPRWEAGTYQPVLWEVANTDRAPVNSKWVNILLSTDGGYTYPIVLATRLPNTGSAMVPVPNIETVAARIKVEANDNIFFNISSQNFRITPPQAAGFTLQAVQNSAVVCLPNAVNISLETQKFLDFNEDITLEIIDGLPAGGTFSFSPATLKPGETSTLTIELADLDNTGQYELQIGASAPGQDTIKQRLYLELKSNDFNDITLTSPADGARGIGLTTPLNWTTSENASQYLVELATNPSFDDPYLLDNTTVTSDVTSFEPNVILDENTLHYWRLRPINACGSGDYLPVSTFHTETLICTGFTAEDTPVVIPGSGLPTKESIISVDVDGIISDLNIPIVTGNYQPVNSLRLSLISPSGTEVILFDEDCGNTTDLALGFDDEAPNAITCPPDDNIVFQPVDSLSKFIGESTKGDWTLRLKVVDSGFGGVGSIGSWKLEFCASSTPIAPILVTNDTLYVPPSQANPVSATVLEAQDEDNSADELIYTLVQTPQAGTLYFMEQALAVGDQFRQSTINAFNLFYLNENIDATLDSFIFVVEDGTGGWISPQTFTIKVDDNATVNTDEPEIGAGLRLFPNPTTSSFLLQLGKPLEQQAHLSLFDAHGRLVQQQIMDVGELESRVAVGSLPRGIYFVRLQVGAAVLTRRVVVQ